MLLLHDYHIWKHLFLYDYDYPGWSTVVGVFIVPHALTKQKKTNSNAIQPEFRFHVFSQYLPNN